MMEKTCILALDIGGTSLKTALCDETGRLLEKTFDNEPVNSNGSLEQVKTAYQKLLGRMKDKAAAFGYAVSAVAADTPGPFDFDAGVSRMEHKYTAIYGVPLRPWFTEVLGDVPVCFVHDSTAFLCGAASAHPEIRDCAGVMIGTGLGFALMRAGQILRNETGGPAVSIFNAPFRGATAEDCVSARGVLNAYNSQAMPSAREAREVALRASNGDAKALAVYREMGAALAEILAPILPQYGVKALYLGGQVSKSFPLFEASLREGLAGVTTLERIEPAPETDYVHLIGATAWYLRGAGK